MDILNIKNTPIEDNSITSAQYHSYNPYTTSFSNNDEIRIVIQQQDVYVHLAESYIYLECIVTKKTESADSPPKFINNFPAFLFNEIRYELNNFEIDRCKNPGITSTMKGYISLSPPDMTRLQIAGWNMNSQEEANQGYYNLCIPLNIVFGFAEDYENILINCKHELILNRALTNQNLFVGDSKDIEIKIEKIQWRVPHIHVSDAMKLKLFKYVEKRVPIQLNYRTWELYEYPVLPQTDKHIWGVKTTTQMNKPRFIIVGFQTKRNNVVDKDSSHFDHCNLSDLKVHLNSETFPYENLNIDFEKNQYAVLYDMFAKFQQSYYYNKVYGSPLLNFSAFKSDFPLVVIDCSRQSEVLKNGIVDLSITIQTKKNFPKETTAYCLIIHDNSVTYNPYTNLVNRSF